ncbi:thioredoxin family protein [Phaeovulum sp.]|uniref:thioredoxin family protein n=1 Tax=Phaeovulum sp. TaxID=2934796 RepID=UPI00272EEE4B|nr:thioredoxin family protein [Phaeovulum sp.]MDP1669067.1 thioredoxin family protein [Phaeovulum sp.]MDZ4117706.1 thioredoxin family protein [Phaeovulum sp.]
MNRRDFLSLTAAVSLATPLALAPAKARAASSQMLAYVPGLIEQRLAKGEVLLVDYHAVWCTTCAAQDRAITALQAENPAYAQKITFIRVDWDTYWNDPVTTSRNIPRRSTLLVLKGDQELGRIVAGTSKAKIKALLDTALAAAGVA